MQQEELEEKVTMLEELIQGFIQRITIVETEMPEFLKGFLNQYKETLDRIAGRIETANKRYDDKKIQQQINELKDVVSRVPKVIGVKNSHHFGAWSKSLIIGIVIVFVITTGSFGTALYLNYQNDRLNEEAYNFWMVRAMYPKTAETIITRLKDDPSAFIAEAEKAMEKQQAIAAAKAVADQAGKDQKTARDNLNKVILAK
ncbi:hypothetical protein DIU31_021570 [Mucilaginibacter rubeus]|uniref:Uncharacterized protein n=1 Tax=Mucilaginibacter rubeus TaxID=2027860 RepID=A0AAE6JJC2_9SPHI|nr:MULTISPECIES: hypothetical protein [Mucilaginibacter]QEM05970.1 hypothetical protein DIU31_021570 [Mucilaginibacter rubeus]QEM18550.1 hypothetical protein DIU38_021785 [Mucilaginibacter gossypii]QTE44908.1 hypothetical protein J3L19_05935 [Mucilaginibacter rubeus]QTE51506.1 hypothetical protein J3L21_05910 [Mucilaginibacter rubeus]QTE56592.1 hypothetical protein J3L23_31150 [Mucilaginibacter rubeus]